MAVAVRAHIPSPPQPSVSGGAEEAARTDKARQGEVSKKVALERQSEQNDGSLDESTAARMPVSRRGGTRLRFDGPTERIVAQILDRKNEVIKQIPPEAMLKLAAEFRRIRGLLFDQQV